MYNKCSTNQCSWKIVLYPYSKISYLFVILSAINKLFILEILKIWNTLVHGQHIVGLLYETIEEKLDSPARTTETPGHRNQLWSNPTQLLAFSRYYQRNGLLVADKKNVEICEEDIGVALIATIAINSMDMRQ